MTSDGIETQDWDKVQELAAALVNASSPDNEQQCRETLLSYLAHLRARYGELPSILATEADFVDDTIVSERLLLRAYEIAESISDFANRRYVALSLADLYATELLNVTDARRWLNIARELTGRTDEAEYRRIEQALLTLEEVGGE